MSTVTRRLSSATTAEAILTAGILPWRLQVGAPAEEDLKSWGHHSSPATVPDDIMAQADPSVVSFVFSCQVEPAVHQRHACTIHWRPCMLLLGSAWLQHRAGRASAYDHMQAVVAFFLAAELGTGASPQVAGKAIEAEQEPETTVRQRQSAPAATAPAPAPAPRTGRSRLGLGGGGSAAGTPARLAITPRMSAPAASAKVRMRQADADSLQGGLLG